MAKRSVLAIIVLTGLLVLGLPQVQAATLNLSRINVTLNAGQNTTVNAYPPSGQTVNIMEVSNLGVVTASINNNVLNLYGVSSGNANVQLCTYDNYCATVYVTVSGSTVNDQISFGQNNINMNLNASATVTVTSAQNNSLYISSNNAPNIVNATLNGNTLNLYANSIGPATIKICAHNSNACGNLSVIVGSNNTHIWFSHNNVSVSRFNAVDVKIYSTQGGLYYVSNNTNPNVVNAGISGNTLNLYGNNLGSVNVTICQSGATCGIVQVTVNSDIGTTPYFVTGSLNQPALNQYYFAQLAVAGGTAPYTFSVASGILPDAISLSSTGLLSGIPYNTNAYNFTIRVTDAMGRTALSNNFYLKAGSVAGTLIYNNGTLINDNGTIYITYKNTKSGFANMAAFTQLGFKTSNVINASTAALTNTGYVISTSQIAHPWGSWVKNGNTIYFVHETGLIPISSYDIFVSNGGQDKSVVNMNSYDFAKPVLSIMTYGDVRLK